MMKCRGILVTVIFLLVIAVAAPAMASPSDKVQSTINVTGHAETTVVPDVAVLSVGIVSTGTDVESARVENDRTMRRIIEALTQQGIDKREITTSQFSLQPIYRSDAKDSGVGTISGYRLQNTVSVVVSDLAKIGTVIDATFQAGANQFQGLRFGLKDDAALRDELLKKAVQDGRRKAGIIADALGVSLGQAISVTENGRMAPVASEVRMLKASAASAPIEAGTLTVGVDVNIVFGF